MLRKSIKIKAPYYGAGSPKQYNWTKDGYHIHGIGVNEKYLVEYDELEITVEGKTAVIRTSEVRSFADRYNSYYKVRNAFVTVAVFSRSLLEPKEEPKPQGGKQTTLYDFLDEKK